MNLAVNDGQKDSIITSALFYTEFKYEFDPKLFIYEYSYFPQKEFLKSVII